MVVQKTGTPSVNTQKREVETVDTSAIVLTLRLKLRKYLMLL